MLTSHREKGNNNNMAYEGRSKEWKNENGLPILKKLS